MPIKKPALLTVFMVVIIDLIGFGIVLPLLPFYASTFHASPIAIGFLYSIYSLAQLIFSPIWGSYSDRIGRRPIMLMSTLGASFAYLLFAFSNSLTLLFISRLIAGVMGGNISTAQAYVADVTTHEERAKGMGMIGAAFGIGFVLGPALSTLLIHPVFHQALGVNQYAAPGFFAAFLSFLSFLLVLTHLPETVKASAAADSQRVVRQSIFSKTFWISLMEQSRSDGKHFLLLLLASVFLLSFGQAALYSSFPLFCEKILNFSAAEVGMQYIYMGVIAIVIQGGLIHLLTKKYREEHLFLIGCLLMTSGIALIPFSTSTAMLTWIIAIMSVGGNLNGPTLNSLVSKKADPSKMGAMMGTSQGMASLGRVIGPTWGGALYAVSFRLPFLATASLLSLTALAAFKLRKN
jgi:MFS family permease